MAIDIHNFEDSNIGQYDLSIVQNAVDGGITSKEEIDSIQDFPTAKCLDYFSLGNRVWSKVYNERQHQKIL